MKFFILAGGYGVRARPLSLIKPKPSFPLHGQPLIKIILKRLRHMGFNEGFINLHYMPEVIRESIGAMPGLSIMYLYEQELSGSKILTGALPGMTGEDEFLFIINGDIFLDLPENLHEHMVRELKAANADGGLLLRRNNDPTYSTVLSEKGFFQGIEKNQDIEKNKGKESLMYTGVALFRRNVIEKITDTNFFHSLLRQSFRIKTFLYDNIWVDIGNPRLYFAANSMYREYLKIDSQSNSFSEDVAVSTGSHVNHCIAWEHTNISGSSTLSNCIITGGLSLHNAYYVDKIIYVRDKIINVEPL